MNDPAIGSTLHDAIAALHAAPFADFIRARDALAKELRSAGDRESAAFVKGLRKPSRPAWSLNRVAHRNPDAFASLDTAVAGIVDAHSGDGDVRTAMTTLREAVRAYTTLAAEQARNESFSLDAGELSNALLAVLGTPASYDDLRNGRLTDIPEAGGLDFLTSLPSRPRLEVSRSAPKQAAEVDTREAAAALEQARATSAALEKARAAAEAAVIALAEAESYVASAEEALRTAQAEVKEALQRRVFARKAKESAAAELRTAEGAHEAAQRRLRTLR